MMGDVGCGGIIVFLMILISSSSSSSWDGSDERQQGVNFPT